VPLNLLLGACACRKRNNNLRQDQAGTQCRLTFMREVTRMARGCVPLHMAIASRRRSALALV
jgi:hypothetical protein